METKNGDFEIVNGVVDEESSVILKKYHGHDSRVEIPDGVTVISCEAFERCQGLETVVIPASVKNICIDAFFECQNLNEFVVDPKNKRFCSVNGLILTKNGKTLLNGVNGDVVVPETVTKIGCIAFDGLENLTSVVIPDSVKVIDNCAFRYCEGLKSITIGSGVERIGEGAFQGCCNVENLVVKGESVYWNFLKKF